MRILLWFVLLNLCSSVLAEEKLLWVGGQQITQEELNAELETLMEAYWWEVSSPPFQERLNESTDWRHRMVMSLLLRYPEGPWGDRRASRENRAFERSINAVVETVPGELAPRVLALLHCNEALLEPPDECLQRHGAALDQHQPDNALGLLFLAQAALARGEVTQAASWMVQAAERERFRTGAWAITKAQFEVFGEAEPLLDDPLKLREAAKEGLGEGMIAHLSTHPINVLGRQCQRAGDEPLMTGCLAVAKAMKLPGTGRLAYNLALAIEERIFERRGEQDKLTALALERQSLKQRFDQVAAVQEEMYRTGLAAPMLEAYVNYGELDTVIDFGATHAKTEATGNYHQVVLKASTPERVRCVDTDAAPAAPDCVTPDMVKAEVERLTDVLFERMQTEPFRKSLAADPSPEAQILLLHTGLDRPDASHDDRLAAASEMAKQFPGHPLANRLVADRCFREPECLKGAAQRLMEHEPEDAQGYLLAAVYYLDAGGTESGLIYLEKSGRAKRLQGAYGLMTAVGAEVISRHMGLAPESDLLGAWEMAPALVSIGYAAALSLPAARLSYHCVGELEERMLAGCITAARSMQLPGGSLIELMMGTELEARLLQTSDDAELADAIDRLARARQLRDDLVSGADRFISDPSFHQRYLEKLAIEGEVAALRWMLTNEEPDDA
ncbi:MAG: hypothetical protein AAGB27_16120 [Pseudomonadota bacterium]